MNLVLPHDKGLELVARLSPAKKDVLQHGAWLLSTRLSTSLKDLISFYKEAVVNLVYGNKLTILVHLGQCLKIPSRSCPGEEILVLL